MPDRSYYLEDEYEAKQQAYKNLIVNIAVYLGADHEQAIDDADDIMKFETELANVSTGL